MELELIEKQKFFLKLLKPYLGTKQILRVTTISGKNYFGFVNQILGSNPEKNMSLVLESDRHDRSGCAIIDLSLIKELIEIKSKGVVYDDN